jgi:hypothetical protein
VHLSAAARRYWILTVGDVVDGNEGRHAAADALRDERIPQREPWRDGVLDTSRWQRRTRRDPGAEERPAKACAEADSLGLPRQTDMTVMPVPACQIEITRGISR